MEVAVEVNISFSNEISILNEDVQIVIMEDSQQFGTLTTSSENIGWQPPHEQYEGVNEIHPSEQETVN